MAIEMYMYFKKRYNIRDRTVRDLLRLAMSIPDNLVVHFNLLYLDDSVVHENVFH